MTDQQNVGTTKQLESVKELLTKAGDYLEEKGFFFGDFGNYYPQGIGYADDVALTLSRNDYCCFATVTQLYGDFSQPHLPIDIDLEMKETEWKSILDNFVEITKHFASAKKIERGSKERD